MASVATVESRFADLAGGKPTEPSVRIMSDELSPDMIWRDCPNCDHHYTLADTTEDGGCPWCAREDQE